MNGKFYFEDGKCKPYTIAENCSEDGWDTKKDRCTSCDYSTRYLEENTCKLGKVKGCV